MKQAEFLPAKAPDLTGVSRSLRGGAGRAVCSVRSLWSIPQCTEGWSTGLTLRLCTKSCFASKTHCWSSHKHTSVSKVRCRDSLKHHPEPFPGRGRAGLAPVPSSTPAREGCSKQEGFCPRCSCAVQALATGCCGCWCFTVVHTQGAQVRNRNPLRLLKT